jgi:hypothetical protein
MSNKLLKPCGEMNKMMARAVPRSRCRVFSSERPASSVQLRPPYITVFSERGTTVVEFTLPDTLQHRHNELVLAAYLTRQESGGGPGRPMFSVMDRAVLLEAVKNPGMYPRLDVRLNGRSLTIFNANISARD